MKKRVYRELHKEENAQYFENTVQKVAENEEKTQSTVEEAVKCKPEKKTTRKKKADK